MIYFCIYVLYCYICREFKPIKMAKETVKPVLITLYPSVIEKAKEESKKIFHKTNLSGYVSLLIENSKQINLKNK